MIEVETPTVGKVTIELPYDEAEVLCRAVGMVNAGNLRNVAPNLLNAVERLVDEFGRNTEKEANKYLAEYRGGQVYVDNFVEEW